MTNQPVLLLGAGLGRRMGGPKVFTRAGEKSFLERILARCRESGSPVTLTFDSRFRERLEALLATLPAPRPRLVESAGELPMLASVQAGLRAGGLEGGFWLWPVDAPFISADGWARAVKTAREAPDAVWKLRAGGRSGHPIWFPAWSVPIILAGSWQNGLLGFLETCPDRIRVLPLEGEELRDFNTPEELAASPKGEQK